MAALLLLLGSELELLGVKGLQESWRDCVGSASLAESDCAAGLRRVRTRLDFICSMAASEMGRPSSFSAMARLSQS